MQHRLSSSSACASSKSNGFNPFVCQHPLARTLAFTSQLSKQAAQALANARKPQKHHWLVARAVEKPSSSTKSTKTALHVPSAPTQNNDSAPIQTAISSQQEAELQANINTDSMNASYLSLVAVSFLWGTYNPIVSWLLHTNNALPPSVLTGIRTVFSAMVMLGVVYATNQPRSSKTEGQQLQQHQHPEKASGSHAGQLPHSYREPEQQHLGSTQAETSGRPDSTNQSSVPLLARTLHGVIPAGVELGLWNFLGTALSVTGLEFTSPTRASFLIQLTAVGTPMMAALAGLSVPRRTAIAALIALSGTCFIALDGAIAPLTNSSQGTSLTGNLGDLLFISACLFFSLATMRLSLYAPRYPPIQLATAKKVTLGVLSLMWLILTPQRSGFTDSWFDALGSQTSFEWVVILFSALGPGALAAFLQTSGQVKVPATKAQVIYSLAPLWSALGSWLVLGDQVGPLTWVGGSIILVASVLAVSDNGAAEELKKP